MALRVGDKVEAQFKGKGKAYPATVKKDNGDGTYALDYDDGDKEDAAKAEHIKAMSGGSSFAPGDRVEAQFNGKGKLLFLILTIETHPAIAVCTQMTQLQTN